MPDGVKTVQVTTIELGERYMGVLLKGDPLTLNFPNPENPTHQFQITLDDEVRKELIDKNPLPSSKNDLDSPKEPPHG